MPNHGEYDCLLRLCCYVLLINKVFLYTRNALTLSSHRSCQLSEFKLKPCTPRDQHPGSSMLFPSQAKCTHASKHRHTSKDIESLNVQRRKWYAIKHEKVQYSLEPVSKLYERLEVDEVQY